MKRERQTTQESPPKVPAYIVTYSDMVTLLLTFFVMLQTLSHVQDPELFNMGRGSFIQSIRELGLGMLYGRKRRPDFGNTKIKYFIATPDKLSQGRTIHAKEEELRQIFRKVARSMTTMPSQIVAQSSDFLVTNIRFSPGEATLDESAKRFLMEFCLSLQQNADSGAGMGSGPPNAFFRVWATPSRFAGALYVLGLSCDQVTEKQQWILSARRAQAVAEFLQARFVPRPPAFAGASLPLQQQGSLIEDGRRKLVLSEVEGMDDGRWRIYWWGAGPGGDWVGKDSPISTQSQILIAVLRAG